MDQTLKVPIRKVQVPIFFKICPIISEFLENIKIACFIVRSKQFWNKCTNCKNVCKYVPTVEESLFSESHTTRWLILNP